MSADPFDETVRALGVEITAGFHEPRFRELLRATFERTRDDPSGKATKLFAQALWEVRSQLEGGMQNPEFTRRFEARFHELLLAASA